VGLELAVGVGPMPVPLLRSPITCCSLVFLLPPSSIVAMGQRVHVENSPSQRYAHTRTTRTRMPATASERASERAQDSGRRGG